MTVHDLAFDRFPGAFPPRWRWLYRAGLRAAIRRAHILVVPSHATAEDLRAHGAPAERIHVTPLAASLPEGRADVAGVLARLGIEEPYVLCPATIEPRKNQVRLIRAYRQVAPDVPHALVLAGPDGWGVEEVDAEMARPGPGRIARTGPLEAGDLDAVYRGADLVAYVSLYEGFGLPVVEAMGRGVAVLASSDRGGGGDGRRRRAARRSETMWPRSPRDSPGCSATPCSVETSWRRAGRAPRATPGPRRPELRSMPTAERRSAHAREGIADRHRPERRRRRRRLPRVDRGATCPAGRDRHRRRRLHRRHPRAPPRRRGDHAARGAGREHRARPEPRDRERGARRDRRRRCRLHLRPRLARRAAPAARRRRGRRDGRRTPR